MSAMRGTFRTAPPREAVSVFKFRIMVLTINTTIRVAAMISVAIILVPLVYFG